MNQAEARLSNEVIINLLELERQGYVFLVIGDVIRYLFEGKDPNPDYIQPRLTMIRDHHDIAIEYLNNRSIPLVLAAHLLDSCNKTIESARQAENEGDLKLARHIWNRFNRLAASLADHIGKEPENGQSWEEWITSIQQEANHA